MKLIKTCGVCAKLQSTGDVFGTHICMRLGIARSICSIACGLYVPKTPEKSETVQICPDKAHDTDSPNTTNFKATTEKKGEKGSIVNNTNFNKVDQHERICIELTALYERKNRDYGDSYHLSYLEEGMAMARIRLGDKLNRFKTLTRSPRSRQVQDESIRDTRIDLANYAIMTIMELDAAKKCAAKECDAKEDDADDG